MTEEENEAIETLQYLCSDDCISKDIIKTIVKLIEKLQKENEELKLKDYYLPAWVTKKYVSKDKIREKLEELKNKEQELSDGQGYWGSSDLQAQIEILEELLEEE